MFHRKKQSASILIIDDDPAVRVAVGALLERAGYRVHTAGSALEGLETARVRLPDVILLDIRMPHVSGLEALEVLRVDPVSRGALIIAFSGCIAAGDVARLRLLGFDAVLEKGAEPLEMIRRLTDSIRARSLESPLASAQR